MQICDFCGRIQDVTEVSIMLTIGERIKNRRIELGMSADDLAKKIGKNRATVYRYEGNDIENFPISVISTLAVALHTSPAYLMGWTEKNKSDTEIDDGLIEISKIFTELSAENRSKLLELSRLYLASQSNNEQSR